MALNINGTTGISGVDGSVSAPAVTGTDSNTGITFPSADTIKLSTGGVERMSITNNGVTSSGHVIQVVSTTKTDTASQASVAAGGKWSNTDFKATITPTSASNKLLIFGIASFDTGNYSQALYLQKDGSDLTAAMGTPAGNRKGTVSQILDADGAAFQQVQHSFQFLDTAGNTNERYYNLAIGHGHNSTVNIFMNRSSTDSDNAQQFRTQSTITVMEIAA
jgi:hypothetical protein